MNQKPTSIPIYQTATFASGDAEELAAVLSGEEPGYAYSRINNPTVTALGDAVAELHDAPAGLALATVGTAAFVAVVASGVAPLVVGALGARTKALAIETFVHACGPGSMS